MELLLERKYKKETYTIGILSKKSHGNWIRICDTCEDKVRDLSKEKKVYSETAIPSGRYMITIEESPKFQRELPYLHDVPQFSGILIHAGNSAADSAGCILVGENRQKGKVLNSRYWERYITCMLKEDEEKGITNYIIIK